MYYELSDCTKITRINEPKFKALAIQKASSLHCIKLGMCLHVHACGIANNTVIHLFSPSYKHNSTIKNVRQEMAGFSINTLSITCIDFHALAISPQKFVLFILQITPCFFHYFCQVQTFVIFTDILAAAKIRTMKIQ